MRLLRPCWRDGAMRRRRDGEMGTARHERQGGDGEPRLASLGMKEGGPLVGINPGASMKAKRWPIERFAAVGCELAANYDAQVLVFGGPDDEGRAAAITRAIPGALSVAGRTRLGET